MTDAVEAPIGEEAAASNKLEAVAAAVNESGNKNIVNHLENELEPEDSQEEQSLDMKSHEYKKKNQNVEVSEQVGDFKNIKAIMDEQDRLMAHTTFYKTLSSPPKEGRPLFSEMKLEHDWKQMNYESQPRVLDPQVSRAEQQEQENLRNEPPDYSSFDLRKLIHLSNTLAQNALSTKSTGSMQDRYPPARHNYTQYMDNKFCMTFLQKQISQKHLGRAEEARRVERPKQAPLQQQHSYTMQPRPKPKPVAKRSPEKYKDFLSTFIQNREEDLVSGNAEKPYDMKHPQKNMTLRAT